MRYFVTLHGETVEVELGLTRDGKSSARIHRRDGPTAGRTHPGGAASASDHALELRPIAGLDRCAVVVDGAVRDVLLAEDAHGMHVTVAGRRFDCAVEDERERAAHLAVAAGPKGPVTVRAPMPGIVRAVLVQPGDTVKAGQPLVILEAMKMENELRADHAGTVRDVKASVGSPVDGGATLLVIEPPKGE